MPIEVLLIATLPVVLAYLLARMLLPKKSEPCRRCDGKTKRIKRRNLDRFLSVFLPLCRVKCRRCKRETLRWSKTRKRIPEEERKRRSGRSKSSKKKNSEKA